MKSQFRNPKQCNDSNYQNLKLFNSLVLEIGNYVICICFEFRILVLPWRPLPRGISPRPRSCCSPEALFHRGESSLIRLLNRVRKNDFSCFDGLTWTKNLQCFQHLPRSPWACRRVNGEFFSILLNPNSTENFKYVRLVLRVRFVIEVQAYPEV